MPRNRAVLLAGLVAIAVMCAGSAVVVMVLRSPGGLGDDDTGLEGDGGTIAWTVDTANGSRDMWVFGDTTVVLDDVSLLGLRTADGTGVWQLPYRDEDVSLTVAGGMAVVQRGEDGRVDVVEPATGRTAWSTPGAVHMVARDDALYLDSCPDRRAPGPDCAITKRRVPDGEVLWTVEDPGFYLQDDAIGGRRPLAPAASAYLPVTASAPMKGALLDTATGRLLPGRVDPQAWYVVAAGDTLVATDHDPPKGDRECTVTVVAVDGPTGKPAWNGTLDSGRDEKDECHRSFRRIYSRSSVLFGSGTDVAAVTSTGRTTLVDFTTGKARWTTEERGYPIAGDDKTLLVRESADTGPIALLDMADGHRLWTAPDPGLPSSSASWEAAVAGDLIAVMGATGDRPFVLVFDTRTGKQLARRGGWFTGIGDGWVMVSTSRGAAAGRLTQNMLRF